MKFAVRGRTAAAVLAFLYFIILLPFSTTLVLQYPDERHYVHSGFRMMETGDYIMPRAANDEIRLRKPIVPYWFSVAGFEVAGKGPEGHRLFYTLGASVILLLTYALARTLGARESDSLLAMLLLAGNPIFIRSAVNAIPDIPLTLFMMVSAIGFCRILLDPPGQAPRWAVWTGWIGGALAILSKGVLALAFLVFVAAFAVLFDRARLKYILSPAPVLAAIALVASWYLYAILGYPTDFVDQFVDDQVQRKITHNPLLFFSALPGYAGVVAASFMMLPLFLLLGSLRGLKTAIAAWPKAITMLVAWSVVVLCIFSIIGWVAGRYVLPIIPLVAVLTIVGFAVDERRRALLIGASRWILAFVLVLQLALLAFSGAIELQLAPAGEAIALLALYAAVLAAGVFVLLRCGRYAVFAFPLLVAVTAPLIFPPIAHLVLPHPGEPVAARLAASGVDPSRAVVVGNLELGAGTRLYAGSAVAFRETSAFRNNDPGNYCVVMTQDARLAESLKQRGFAVEVIQGGWRKNFDDLVSAVTEWRLAEVRNQHLITAYFATCPAG
jgi:4-amino-4-deoxy-L-arabinose transferase-like glycosyltransferase